MEKTSLVSFAVLISLVLAGCPAPQEVEEPGPDEPGPPVTPPPEEPEPTDGRIAWEGLLLPPGVEGEVVLSNLSFPTAIDWDDDGTLYVSEVGFTEFGPRIFRRASNGTLEELNLTGANLTEQLLDITVDNGTLWFSTTGKVHALDLATNETREVVTGLPAWGDHRTDEILVGPDGRVYVSQGTVTNSGIMGVDQAGAPNAVNAVVLERPGYADVPCVDIAASGANYETANPHAANITFDAYEGAAEDVRLVWLNETAEANRTDGVPTDERILTGPFSPMGTPRARGETVPGDVRCNGAVLSFEPDGSDLRVEAWGFRNPFGMKFVEDTLWVSDNGFDNRGSRPVGATPDLLFRVDVGANGTDPTWYGWPDHSGGHDLTDPFFSPLFGPPVAKLLLEDPNEPPRPFTYMAAHASSNKFDVAPAGSAYEGDLFLAEFGTLNIEFLRGAHSGMAVVRVDLDTGRVTEFLVGVERWGGEFRPVEAAFGPDGRLYVVDFGPWVIEAPDPASQGEAITDAFEPGTGRVLAFTLPSNATWEGYPVGSIGPDSDRPANGAYADEAPAGAAVVEGFEYGFGPASGTARVGEPVAFRNIGVEGHTATEVNGTWNTGFEWASNTTFVWTPEEAGTYDFFCILHPVMRSTITVEASETDGADTGAVATDPADPDDPDAPPEVFEETDAPSDDGTDGAGTPPTNATDPNATAPNATDPNATAPGT